MEDRMYNDFRCSTRPMGKARWRYRKLWRSAGLSVSSALFVLLIPATVTAQSPQPVPLTPEEKAAILVYDEGKELYAAGRHEDALAKFEMAYAVVKNKWVQNRLGLTYAVLGRCDEALPLLVTVRGSLGDEAIETVRTEAEVGCRIQRARAAASEYRCNVALDDLVVLDEFDLARETREPARALTAEVRRCVDDFGTETPAGQEAARQHAAGLAALDAGRLEEAAAAGQASLDAKATARGRLLLGNALAGLGRCDEALVLLADATPPATSGHHARHGAAVATCTEGTEAAAAYRLFVSARAAVAEEDWGRAGELYSKALVFSDQPYLRRELAGLLLRTEGCAAARRVLEGIPEGARTARQHLTDEVCQRFAPTGLEGQAQRAYIVTVARALELRQLGRAADARSSIASLAQTGQWPALASLDADLLFEAGDCEGYLIAVDATSVDHSLLTKPEVRRAQCLHERVAAAPVDGSSAADLRVGLERGGSSTLATAGWVLIGTGGAISVTSIVLIGLWKPAYDAAAAAPNPSTHLKHNDRARDYSIAAGVLGGVGVAALATGVVLLLLPGDEPQEPLPAADTTVALHPLLGPGLLGVGGSF